MILGVQEWRLLNMLINIGGAAAFGTFGTYWYYLHARRTVRRLTLRGETDIAAIGRAGGTSWWAPIIFLIVFFGLGVLAFSVDDQVALAP